MSDCSDCKHVARTHSSFGEYGGEIVEHTKLECRRYPPSFWTGFREAKNRCGEYRFERKLPSTHSASEDTQPVTATPTNERQTP